jgi:glycosyltransferase 2 family protein
VRLVPVVLGAAGTAVIAVLVYHFGAEAVIRTLLAIGWYGFAAILAIHLLLIAVMGIAWRLLLPGARPLAAVWGRLVRDSASEVLPLSQVGGYVAGARAIAGAGVAGSAAVATTIVDVTLECLAQLAYTALALLLLLELAPGNRAAAAVAVGLAVAALLVGGFLFVQRRGFGAFDRLARSIIGHRWAERTADGAAALHAAIGAAYRSPLRLFTGFALHLGCWVANTSEAWLALRLAGAPLGFAPVLVIEGLLYAIRSVAFAVPNAAGVQEGAYIMLGAGFGVTPDLALALSLLKRARDFVIGVPALAAWNYVESGRLWRRLGPPAAAIAAAPATVPRPR